MDRSRLYNKSIREAYENMVKGAGAPHLSADHDNSKVSRYSASIIHEDNRREGLENSEFSDNESLNEYDDEGEENDADDDGEAENDYTQFKKSLIQDDEWLDDESDTDYTEEADQSFLLEKDNDCLLYTSRCV